MSFILKFLSFCFLFLTVFLGQGFAYFSDVPENHPNSVAINYLYEEEVVSGYEDGNYGVFREVNRAEFLKFVVLASKTDFIGAFSEGFSDVEAGDWFYDYVVLAFDRGWVNGYDDGTFRPGNVVIQAEALKMLGEVFEWDISDKTFVNWYDPYVLYADRNGIWEQEMFDPFDVVERTEIAEMTYRAMADKFDFESENFVEERFVDIDVDFYAQAPFGEWGDERQGEGCEEASVLMAVNWAVSGSTFGLSEVKELIISVSKYEEGVLGTFHDTSLKDTYEAVVKGYFNFGAAEYVENVTIWDIRDQIYEGNLVVVPINGQKVYNSYFGSPGPLQHMVLVKGYDPKAGDFIVHDPGTRWGADYRYSLESMDLAINDYITGSLGYMPVTDKRMIVFRRAPSLFASL